jgi:hypothetical protein
LHAALGGFGTRFMHACRTAPCDRFVALLDLDSRRPGLVRDHDPAGVIAVEGHDLPMEGFGRLVASVA